MQQRPWKTINRLMDFTMWMSTKEKGRLPWKYQKDSHFVPLLSLFWDGGNRWPFLVKSLVWLKFNWVEEERRGEQKHSNLYSAIVTNLEQRLPKGMSAWQYGVYARADCVCLCVFVSVCRPSAFFWKLLVFVLAVHQSIHPHNCLLPAFPLESWN